MTAASLLLPELLGLFLAGGRDDAFFGEVLGVDAFLASDMSSVLIDEFVLQFVNVRYRFSLAHEIGHYWLHDDLYQAVAIGSVSDWKRVQADIGDEYQWFEFQANAFAGLNSKIRVDQDGLVAISEQPSPLLVPGVEAPSVGTLGRGSGLQ